MIHLLHPDTRDPAYNLALEEHCLRRLDPAEDYLLLYVNGPAVVIGRHQDLRAEVDPAFLARRRIPVLRRISGGGAVYHDAGNLNYSFITAFDRRGVERFRELLAPLLDCLAQLDLAVHATEKNDIFIDRSKVSGAAQYTDTRRMVSHGTLLFDTDLSTLERALTPAAGAPAGRGVASLRSPVTNIADHLKRRLDRAAFRRWILRGLRAGADRWGEQTLAAADQRAAAGLAEKKYRSGAWNLHRRRLA